VRRIRFIGVFHAAIFAPLCFWATRIDAQQAAAPTGDELQQITVTAKKTFPDEVVTEQVATALHDDPYILDTHVTITTKNGVVTLHGLALDNWDVAQMKRLVRKMAGVRRVVNDLDVLITGD
jgi:osmotically-inducible protein OsmY